MDEALVINLDSRPDRWARMKEAWSPFLNLVRVSAEPALEDDRPRHRRTSEALGWTHMSLIADAQRRGLKTILVLEDDAVPEPGFFHRWTELKQKLDSDLDSWEVFNGGAHFLRDYFGFQRMDHSVLIQGQIACAGHFLYLNLSATSRFLEWPKTKEDIDMFFCNRFKLSVAYPILAKQANGASDIIGETRDWTDTYIQNELAFKRNLGDLWYEFKSTRSRF